MHTHSCTHPVLSTEQYYELPDEDSGVFVDEVVVSRAFLSFVLGKLYNVHLVGLFPETHKHTQVRMNTAGGRAGVCLCAVMLSY